ncbi:MAG TPA: NAD-binding protein, partial [Caulobacter sp.]|nr:NAD-binding protein [Caulobacter sp.]
MNHLLVFGYGFTGQALARRLRGEGWTVTAVVRTPETAAKARAQGVAPIEVADRAGLVE